MPRHPWMVVIRDLTKEDPGVMSSAFAAIGWDKPRSQFESYFQQGRQGARETLVAEHSGQFVGYLTIVWESHYEPFRKAAIPEIMDLNVLPHARRRGVASALMGEAESRISRRSPEAGIGVGLYADYGPAQRMYARRGYVPDGRGICYDGHQLPPMATTVNDDSLTLYFTRRLR